MQKTLYCIKQWTLFHIWIAYRNWHPLHAK